MSVGRLRLGVVVQGGPTRGLSWTTGPAEGGLLNLLASSQRPWVPLKIPRKHVRRMGGLMFTNVYREPYACSLGWGSLRPGEVAGEERRGEFDSPPFTEDQLHSLSLPLALEHSAGRGERCCSSDSSFSWCAIVVFQAALSTLLAPQPRHSYFFHSSTRILGYLENFHILAHGLPLPGTYLV